jgi:glutaredoxin-like YruB-family protein
MDIKIYYTPTCPYCIQAKKYFDKKKIAYTDFNVVADKEKAQEMIDLSGQMGVPVIKIDNKIIIGFDQEEIDKALK